MTQPSIGILLISTWKYNKFIDPVISDIKKYLFPDIIKQIYLHTDSTNQHDATVIPIKHEPWPYIALKKFHTFAKHSDIYSTEYVLSMDIDVLIKDFIESDILNDLIAVYHSGFYKQRGTPETRPNSTAFIDENKEHNYVAGGFIGGKKNLFIHMCNEIKKNIDIDLDNNIIAKWHDESHFNKYVNENINQFTLLEPEYMSFGSDYTSKSYLAYYGGKKRYKSKIVALQNSQKGFDKFVND